MLAWAKAAIAYFPLGALLFLGGLMPARLRGSVFGFLGRILVRYVPTLRDRVTGGLTRVYPDMPVAEQNRLSARVGNIAARTLGEILFNRRFKQQSERFHLSGEGLSALRAAKEAGKGAIVVSAHYGQWEAIRHALDAEGMPVGAVYRENENRFYEARFLKNIKIGGEPAVSRGGAGNRAMIKHLRSGGFFALLVDQKLQTGELIPFLGHEALTATAAADLALKYELPLVPAFATRRDNQWDIDIEVEPEIAHSDAVTMMTEVNNRISARIHAKPEQWYWLHRRWEQTELYYHFHKDEAAKTDG